MFCKEQSGLGRIALLRRLVVEELVVPNLLLSFPIDNVPLFYRSPELNFAKIMAFFEVGCDVDLSRPVSGDAVWYYSRLVSVAVGNEACFDGRRAIVEN